MFEKQQIVTDMGIFYQRKQGERLTERRRYPRRPSEGTQVYVYAQGESVMRCKVRDISRAGALILTDIVLPLALPVELAFTCLHTRQIVKIYRRSAYVARASEDGVVALFFYR
jgi:PilZ domain